MTSYSVYMLVDPRDGVVFYVGMTSRPLLRWQSHSSNSDGPAWSRISEVRQLGMKCRVRMMGVYEEKGAAMRRERELIRHHIGTVVNTVGTGYRRRQANGYAPPGQCPWCDAKAATEAERVKRYRERKKN